MEKPTKSKKEARDEKLRDQKTEEQILKSLESEDAATPEQKFALLLRKHVETERNGKRVRQELKQLEKQLETVLREKENLQREYNKNVLMRDKLQEVCREQQKLIKSVKNESMQKIREEEERRKESQSKFQGSLNEITQALTKNNEENIKLRDHNTEMAKKLKFLAEQYHTRELQLEKLNEQVQIESQLHQAKLNKFEVEAAMEKEILLKEKQLALEKLMQSQRSLKELSEREAALKEQLNLYTAKYDDFQSSLQKSNNVFATYKVELEKMSKNTKKLEKESLDWKHKWEKSNATLIELATEKKERDEHAMRCNKQVEQLQKLLRALQHERTHLYKTLRDNNVECPALPQLPPEPEMIKTSPINSSSDKEKMDIMSKNCAELKQTLATLQNQMKILNLKGAEAEAQTKQLQLQQQDENVKKRQKRKQNKSKNNKNTKESTPTTEETITETAPVTNAFTEENATAVEETPVEEVETIADATVETKVPTLEENETIQISEAVDAVEVVDTVTADNDNKSAQDLESKPIEANTKSNEVLVEPVANEAVDDNAQPAVITLTDSVPNC